MAQSIQYNALRRLSSTHAIAEFYRSEVIPTSNGSVSSYPTDIASILEDFSDIFTKPQGLPPSRNHDHAIHLLPNTNPVQVRPYRYFHFKKKEMEKLVTKMFNDRIIKTSTNLFSSSVILIRKKDSTWRFCVDYHVLNAVMICDHFSIPPIYELFDKLHRTRYFSNLDLLARYHQI